MLRLALANLEASTKVNGLKKPIIENTDISGDLAEESYPPTGERYVKNNSSSYRHSLFVGVSLFSSEIMIVINMTNPFPCQIKADYLSFDVFLSDNGHQVCMFVCVTPLYKVFGHHFLNISTNIRTCM